MDIPLGVTSLPTSMMNKSITINTSANGYYKQQVVHINYGPLPRF